MLGAVAPASAASTVSGVGAVRDGRSGVSANERVTRADTIRGRVRVELTPNGAFNVTEFGTVKDPAQYKVLRAYSPYHRVKDGTAYPAVLMLTGENDGRVDPYNSRKMIARLQAATKSDAPIILRISMDTGHGIGTSLSQRVEEDADRYAFLMSQLGMK